VRTGGTQGRLGRDLVDGSGDVGGDGCGVVGVWFGLLMITYTPRQ
jgi:hypothetical protein